jgi:membrane protease YdiL (CAAX protease family)
METIQPIDTSQTVVENPFLKIRTRWLIPWLMLASLPFGIPISILEERSLISKELSAALIQILVFHLLFYWAYRKCRKAGVDFVDFFYRGEKAGLLSPAVLMATLLIFSVGALMLISNVLLYVSPAMLEDLERFNEPVSLNNLSGISKVLEILLTVLFAPVVEELVFRGILLNRWAVKWGMIRATLLSAFFFAILHVLNVFGAFFFALCMTILYVKTKTLLVPMAVHALYNTVIVIIDLLSGPVDSPPRDITMDDLRSSLLMGLVLVGVTLPPLLAYIRRNWPGAGSLPSYSATDYNLSARAATGQS